MILRSSNFIRVEHSISGHIVGHLWSGPESSLPISFNILLPVDVSPEPSFKKFKYEDFLKKVLRSHGGDFQDPKFSQDTGIVVIRKSWVGNNMYIVHKRTISVERFWPSLIDREILIDVEADLD